MKNVQPKLVIIAGGSGSGKSTLAYGLQYRYPEKIGVIHFDDYHKNKQDIPEESGMKNWDCPGAINFEQLHVDIQQILSEKEIHIMTKSKIHNPEYEQKGRIPYIIKPKPIMILEGYMSLWDERIRNLSTCNIFLSLSDKERLKRRNKNVQEDIDAYTQKILLPGHRKYVESTSQYADICIDAAQHTAQEVQTQAIKHITKVLTKKAQKT